MEKERLKKACAGAAGRNMGRSEGVAGATGWRQDVIVNMSIVCDLNQVLACSSGFGKVWTGTSALRMCILVFL